MTQVTLPKELEQGFDGRLADMPNGGYGYVAPWSMEADTDGTLWIDTNAVVEKNPYGTLSMKVTKMAGGFVVNVKLCRDYRWTRYAVREKNGRYQPVSELIQ